MEILRGLLPVLMTPFDTSGEVDTNKLKLLTEHLCSQDIAGLWVLGTGSEDMAMSFRQRLTVAQTVSDADTKNKKIFMGTGFYSYKDTTDFLFELRGLKFDAVHYMPYHPLISHDRIVWTYQDLAERSANPVWLYFSGNWSQTLPFEKIAHLSTHQNIGGVKFSSSNIVHVQQAASLSRPDFQVISAVVRTLYSCLHIGITATTTVEACAYYQPIINIFKTFARGDYKNALYLQQKLNVFLDSFPRSPSKDNFLKIAESKYVLSQQGLCGETMAAPYRQLDNSEKKEIDLIIKNNSDWIFE